LDRIPCIDENNVKYIMRSYLRRWKQRLLSCGIPSVFPPTASSSCRLNAPRISYSH
jgi:hypothetical protein